MAFAFRDGTAVFTGVETEVIVTWSTAMVDTTYKIVGAITVPSGASITFRLKNKLAASVTVEPSALFTGQVDLFAFKGTT